MFDSAPFTVQPWKNETCLQGHLLDNILNNHFLSEYMQWNYASFNVTLNYLMHENLEQIIIVKLLVISQTVPFTLCAARTIIFQRENLNYLIVCFNQCTLSFQKSLFSIADLFAVHYLWVVKIKIKINAVLWHSVRQTFTSLGLFMFAHIACLLQLWIKTSELDYSIRKANFPRVEFFFF